MKFSKKISRPRIVIVSLSVLLPLSFAFASFVSSQTKKQPRETVLPGGTRVSVEDEDEGDPRDREAYWEMRRGGITPANIAEARKKAERLPRATSLPHSSPFRDAAEKSGEISIEAVTPGGSSWVSFGPKPITSGGFTFSGRVPAIAVDPVDANTIYAGGANGGVWKSTNGGVDWSPMAGESTMPSLAIGSIAIDPSNRNIIYAGTGESNGSTSHSGRGVLKSTNGGSSWTIIGDGDPFPIGGTTTYRVRVSPTGVLWVASNQGLHRSSDGGVTWKRLKSGVGFANGDVRDLAMSADGNRMFAIISNFINPPASGFYRSTDAGTTWTKITSGLTAVDFNIRSRIAIAKSNSNIGYLIVDPVANSAFFTTNGGTSWSPLPFVNPAPTYGGYNLEVGVDPVNASIVYVLGFNVWVNSAGTTGGGWTELPSQHVDHHAIAFPPCSVAPCPYYVGNDGGVYQVQPQGSAQSVSVTSKNFNLAITEFVGGDLGINFLSDPRAIGGSQDNGTEVYQRDATSNPFEWIQGRGGDGGYAYLDRTPDFRHVAYHEFQACGNGNNVCGVEKSVFWGYDNWSSFSNGLAGLSTYFYAFYLPDRSDRLHFAYAANGAVYENKDENSAWYQSSQGLGSTPTAIGIAPTDSRVIYAGLPTGQVYRTGSGNSGGQSNYVQRSTGLPSGFFVTSIAVDSMGNRDANGNVINPAPDVVYICGSISAATPSQVVFKTVNGGQQWTNISGNLPAMLPAYSILTYFAGTTRVLVIGTDVGVFFSTNEGQSWTSFNSGLPATKVAQISIDRDQTTIAAFTAGRGAFKTDISGSIGNQAPVSNPGGPYNGTIGTAVQFNGSASFDPDGFINSYQWTFGDGTNGSGPTPTHVYATANTYTVTLTVTDNGNLQNSHSTTATITTGGGGGGGDTVWVEDSLPAGATPAGDSEGWNWISSNPAPFSGTLANQSNIVAGIHQHYFFGATNKLVVSPGNVMVAYVYLDPLNLPSEIMVQWNSDALAWSHRAYWGQNLIPWGTDGTQDRRFMGALPAAGGWVRLEVPANLVGLENQTLNGLAFTLYNGRATWDHAGKATSGGGGGGGGPIPVGYWKFDESSGLIATDSSTNGLNGFLTNGPTRVPGRVNNALNFDGFDDYVQVGSQTALQMTSTFTISAWINPSSGVGTRQIVNREGEYNVGMLDGVISWAMSNTSPGWIWVSTGYSPPLFQWTHIAVTYDNGVIKTYANGSLVHTFNGSGPIIDGWTTENDFRIGSRQCEFCAEYFQGGIDEVRMYNVALTAAQVQTLANLPSPPPQPPINNEPPKIQWRELLRTTLSLPLRGF